MHLAGFAALLAVSLLPAGCMSGGDTAMAVPARGPINTGTYPNLNVAPRVAAPPITDDDKARLTSEIASAQSAQTAAGEGAGTTGDPAHLETLATQHGDDTLKAIAAQ
jgi:hypothetical protein